MIKPSRSVTVKSLFDGPVRDYSIYANVRAIPDMIDGLKTSQRKAFFAANKKNPSIGVDGIKVSQLANYAAEITEYHHGEGSLEGTMVGLAQDFPGTNNFNLLQPIGQFGSRLSPAPGAGRYIFTKISPNASKIFNEKDEKILQHEVVDGVMVEPVRYLPIIPMILVNGSEGMGTGHACKILQHDPKVVRDHVIEILSGRTPKKRLIPSWRGHTGKIEMTDSGQVSVQGSFKRLNTTTIEITELPVWMYQDDFKEILLKLEDAKFIHSFDNESTAERFRFVVSLPRVNCALDDQVLINKFKLISRFSQNFTVWTPDKKIRRYASAEELVLDYVSHRLEQYEIRRVKEIDELDRLILLCDEKIRFIRLYLERAKEFSGLTRSQLIEYLSSDEHSFVNVESLIGMPIYTLTKDQIEKLESLLAAHKATKSEFESSTAKDIWLKELHELKI